MHFAGERFVVRINTLESEASISYRVRPLSHSDLLGARWRFSSCGVSATSSLASRAHCGNFALREGGVSGEKSGSTCPEGGKPP